MELSERKIAGVLFALNWQGHVEIPDQDVLWISRELEKAFNARKRNSCENCGQYAIIIIPTQMGGICEDCIENIGRMAEDMRTELEGKPGYDR